MSVNCHAYKEFFDVEPVGLPGSAPYDIFETKKGQICIGAITPKSWKNLWKGLNAPEIANQDRFATVEDRLANEPALRGEIESRLKEKSASEWEALLADAGVPCGEVKTALDFTSDPQVAHLGLREEVMHPTAGRMMVPGSPFRLERSPTKTGRPAPLLGQHTSEVLSEMGYESEKIEQLIDSGVIGQAKTPATK
jgi:formyl-CoA transferase